MERLQSDCDDAAEVVIVGAAGATYGEGRNAAGVRLEDADSVGAGASEGKGAVRATVGGVKTAGTDALDATGSRPLIGRDAPGATGSQPVIGRDAPEATESRMEVEEKEFSDKRLSKSSGPPTSSSPPPPSPPQPEPSSDSVSAAAASD